MGTVEIWEFDASYFPLSIFSCICCLVLYYYIAPWLSSLLVVQYRTFDIKTQLFWRANILSTTHSLVVISLCLYTFCYESYLTNNPISEESIVVRSSCAILIGYMFADTYITIAHYNHIGAIGFIFHHVACVYGYYATVIHGVLCYLANFRLMAEISTPFVNMRWFLSTLGYSKTSYLYFTNGLLMLISFYLVRIFAMPYYWYKVYKVLNTADFIRLGNMRLIPVLPCVILDILNIYWGYKMYLGARKTVTAKADTTSQEH